MTTKTQTKQNTEQLDEMFEYADGTNTEFTDVFPTIQWFHGSKQIPSGIGRTGGFFIESKKYPSFSADGWTEQTVIARDGTELHGFGAEKSYISVIRMKYQWIKDEGKNIPLRQALVILKDTDDIFVISLKGASKAIAFEKRSTTIVVRLSLLPTVRDLPEVIRSNLSRCGSLSKPMKSAK